MDVIGYHAADRLLTIGRGHPYPREDFFQLTADLEGFDVCHVEQPVAQRLIGVQTAAEFSAMLCYDMPGVDFTAQDAPRAIAPDAAFVANFHAMLEAGIGMVFMHHALAAWPAWPGYAEIVGGRFHYRSATLRDVEWPDSGYRHAVTHRVRPIARHPVTEGLPDVFEMTDELYLCPVFEEDVVPLLASDYDFRPENFYSAAQAVAGHMHSRSGWTHPAGSSLVGWATHAGNSPIVYLQGGDDASAMANPHFRRLVHNAIRWVSTPQARAWAHARNGSMQRGRAADPPT